MRRWKKKLRDTEVFHHLVEEKKRKKKNGVYPKFLSSPPNTILPIERNSLSGKYYNM